MDDNEDEENCCQKMARALRKQFGERFRDTEEKMTRRKQEARAYMEKLKSA